MRINELEDGSYQYSNPDKALKNNITVIEGECLVTAYDEHQVDVLIHQCNCFRNMGKGIAAKIKAVFPAAYRADCATSYGDREKLGTFSMASSAGGEHAGIIVNLYSQFKYGGKKQRHTDYAAIRKGLISLRESGVFTVLANELGREPIIGIPLLGAGLGGGDWNVIEKIFIEELQGYSIHLYKL